MVIQPYYEEPGIKIYHGDCREILPQIEPVDLVLTDPPYGKTLNGWDNKDVTFQAFDLFDWPLICTSQNPLTAELICRYIKKFRWADVYEKSHATGFLSCEFMPLRKHEDILYFGSFKFKPYVIAKKKENIRPHGKTGLSSNYGNYTVDQSRKRTIKVDQAYSTSIVKMNRDQNYLHPNQKPLRLMKYLLSISTDEGNLILDPFMGSGTTLRAAKDLGRKAIGIEIEERYCRIAVERLKQECLDLSIGSNSKGALSLETSSPLSGDTSCKEQLGLIENGHRKG